MIMFLNGLRWIRICPETQLSISISTALQPWNSNIQVRAYHHTESSWWCQCSVELVAYIKILVLLAYLTELQYSSTVVHTCILSYIWKSTSNRKMPKFPLGKELFLINMTQRCEIKSSLVPNIKVKSDPWKRFNLRKWKTNGWLTGCWYCCM